MKSYKLALLYGFLIWLIPYMLALVIYLRSRGIRIQSKRLGKVLELSPVLSTRG